MIDTKHFAGEFYLHLTKDLIPYWSGLEDTEYGGFYDEVDPVGRVEKKASKGCILNSRILWFFSNSYMLLKDLTESGIIFYTLEELTGEPGDEEKYEAQEIINRGEMAELCLKKAEHAYKFLCDAFLDKEMGGVYWSVKYYGAPEDTLKHTYNMAYAIYALSSYFDASGDRSAYDLAMQISDLVEEKCTDDFGYLEAFNRDFTPTANEELSKNGVLAEKTMNSILHMYEAYTELLRVTKKRLPAVCAGPVYSPGNAKLAAKISNRLKFILDIIINKMYNPKKTRLEVFFDSQYNSLIDLHSYGHDIETSWLIDRGLEILADAECSAEIEPITLAMAEKVFSKAYRNHSVMSECENGRNDATHVWWVQAESIIGFTNASRKYERRALKVTERMRANGASEAEIYATEVEAEKMAARLYTASVDIWECVKEKFFITTSPTEWYEELDENLAPKTGLSIVRPWKCPYHNGRLCIEMIRRLLDD